MGYRSVNMVRVFVVITVTLLMFVNLAHGENLGMETGNMITDPGFELSPRQSRWGKRNWWKRVTINSQGKKVVQSNTFSFAQDEDRPHSGKYSQKISLIKHLGGDLQFFHALKDVVAGDSIQIRFWTRGPENMTQILMQLRMDVSPWTTYFKASIPLSNQWQEHVFNVTLPPKTQPETMTLMFNLDEEISFWMDDVSVVKLKPKEDGEVAQGNQIPNGTFEVGIDKWYATFREIGGYVNSPVASENNIKAVFESVPIDDAPHKKNCLRFEVLPDCRIQITSAFFKLKYGRETRISFWSRNEDKRYAKLKVAIVGGEFPNLIEQFHTFQNRGTKWAKHTFYVKPKPSVGGRYVLDIKSQEVGKYLIDDIQVTQELSSENAILETPNVGWQRVDESALGNVFTSGQQPEFDVLVEGLPGEKQLKLTGSLLDTWGNQLKSLSLKVPLNEDGLGRARLKLPADQYGAFKAEMYLEGVEGNKQPAVEIVYSVPVALPPIDHPEDSFFGSHVHFTPYNLHLAKLAGVRWLRCHPPLDTKWEVVEPEKGVFKFSLEGAKRATEMGFAIMGSLDSVPKFYADIPEKAFHTWYRCYPPKGEEGWKAWERYVQKTTEAFRPYIHTWEISNEPDGAFMQIPDGLVREEIYLDYVKHTNAALANRKDITLIAGVITGAARTFMQDILDLGVGQYVDALSFHHYRRNIKEGLSSRQKDILHWKGYSNRNGDPLVPWHTEGYVLPFVPTWLKTSGHVHAESEVLTPGIGTAKIIQVLVSMKAMGARTHFLYTGFTQPNGMAITRADYAAITDLNGMTSPGLPAHAASVYFLEGSKPVGYKTDVTSSQSEYSLATFTKNEQRIQVLWSETDWPIGELPELEMNENVRFYDMMGNLIRDKRNVTVSCHPIYMVQ
ncbi:MAG TPA: hypothetical protein DCM28_09575 [Phycisphaerales bacterium]|nr:hypothetical protein [Phycisphaerales bacterium]HCD32238.1 hypothetical protein [Phycisphaerales bacterium]